MGKGWKERDGKGENEKKRIKGNKRKRRKRGGGVERGGK